jgi:hypothetical protein
LRLLDILFYADNGLISGEDANEVQHLLDLYKEKFAGVGLKMSADKTEAMIINGSRNIPITFKRSISS